MNYFICGGTLSTPFSLLLSVSYGHTMGWMMSVQFYKNYYYRIHCTILLIITLCILYNMVIEYYCHLLSLVLQIFQTFGCTKIGNKFTYINRAHGGSGGYSSISSQKCLRWFKFFYFCTYFYYFLFLLLPVC